MRGSFCKNGPSVGFSLLDTDPIEHPVLLCALSSHLSCCLEHLDNCIQTVTWLDQQGKKGVVLKVSLPKQKTTLFVFLFFFRVLLDFDAP